MPITAMNATNTSTLKLSTLNIDFPPLNILTNIKAIVGVLSRNCGTSVTTSMTEKGVGDNGVSVTDGGGSFCNKEVDMDFRCTEVVSSFFAGFKCTAGEMGVPGHGDEPR